MVKRWNWQSYGLLAFVLIILLVSWENNRSQAALIDSDIPEEAIRLRILAHSDSVQDQALKRRVRDAIIEQMNSWVTGPTTIEDARDMVNSRLPELEALVGREIARNGYEYTYTVELGRVPFPAKMYGNKVYPAGDYEALRVTIGAGEGQNWWCVLFPPLCFVDAASGEAVAKEETGETVGEGKKDEKAGKGSAAGSGSRSGSAGLRSGADQAKQAEEEQAKAKQQSQDADVQTSKDAAKGKVTVASASASDKVEPATEKADLQIESKKEVRFFLWDFFRSLFEMIRGWFA